MAYDIIRGRQDGKDWSCGIVEMGSFLTPTSVLNKVDDVRYDIRNVGANMTAGVFTLAGAFAFLAFAKLYKAGARGRVA